jgi:hypothetical protein
MLRFQGSLAGTLAFLAMFASGALFPSSGQAQTTNSGAVEEAPEGRGFFMVGLQRLDVGSLNEGLAGAGFPRFSDSALTLGGGGMGVVGPLLLGGEGHGVLGSEESSADGAFQTRLGGGYGMLTVGYDLLPDQPGSLYPMMGFGAGAMSVRIDERGAPSFDDLLMEPRRGVEVSRVSFLMMVALGGDYLFGVGSMGPELAGIALGMRLGYMTSVAQRSWSTEVGSVAGGPDLAPEGPFIRFQVGGGRRH